MQVATAVATRIPVERPATHREPVHVSCPGCGHRQQTAATTVKCGSCRLVAPLSAFSGAVATQKYGMPRAFTIRGNID